MARIKDSRQSALTRRFVPVVSVAVLVGLVSAILVAKNSDLQVRDFTTAAVAEPDGPEAPVGSPGDSRIIWTPLPTSLTSPLVRDGDSVWFGVAERLSDEGPFISAAYRYTPKTGELVRVGQFRGRPTAAVMAGDEFAIGAGQDVVLVARDGSTRTITGQLRPSTLADSHGFITALEYADGVLYVAYDAVNVVEELDATTGYSRRKFQLGDMPSPQTLVLLDEATLLASTPFGRRDGTEPASVAVDLLTGTATRVELGKPFSFSKDDAGQVVASQAVPGGGVSRIAKDELLRVKASPLQNSIPWNGRWDLIATSSDNSVWGSVAGSGKIYHQRGGSRVDEFALPVFPMVPTLPEGAKFSNEEAAGLRLSQRTVDYLVALGDGSLVVLSSSPGGALGYITGQ